MLWQQAYATTSGTLTVFCCALMGTLRFDDATATRTSKTTIDLVGKTTTLHVHLTFLYISLPFLHDYDVKLPNFTFSGGRKQATTKFYFLSKLEYGS